MRILIQGFNLAPNDLGGSERSARELAGGLRAIGHDLRFVLSDGSKPYPAEIDGIPIDIVAGLPIGKSPLHGERAFLSRMLWSLRGEVDAVLFLRALAYLRVRRPDVILMNNPAGHGSAFMLAARWLKIPYVPILRDYGWVCAFGIMMRGGRNCDGLCGRCKSFSVARRALLRRAPVTVAISQHMQRVARDLAGVGTARVVYNSVPDTFHASPPAVRLDPDRMRFGYIGRIHPSKGVVDLLEGWGRSALGEQGHRLEIAGDIQQGFARADLLEAPGVTYLGRVEALPFLDRLDVLMVPALWAEPFGRTIIEGLARRCYVVAGPRGATKELIPTGCGETLPEVTAEAVSNCLKRLQQTLRPDALSRAFDAQAESLALYKAARMIADYDAIVRECASRPNATFPRPAP
ncbi:glycosyltransferase [Pseudotabrizicola algicola]|uniref:Glycosyltransferase family 4 protein n=1 Tax=Pseudotabrizicola algicola TaxID=2709381 RepID=A0A6B3RP30_9RHOB|nr:glycosyltransferase [Pseudotabrizicola algicola]NEX45855.1 glycosyltransferase family 4 protein [Pseudotabrizicola algicola]